ncbi:MAG: hypothetical protein ACTTH5_02650 [Wolinella sp.]
MSEVPTQNPDYFTEQLTKERESLQACQQSRSLSSCLACPLVLGCATRQAYVKAVYESMSQGEGGNFDF